MSIGVNLNKKNVKEKRNEHHQNSENKGDKGKGGQVEQNVDEQKGEKSQKIRSCVRIPHAHDHAVPNVAQQETHDDRNVPNVIRPRALTPKLPVVKLNLFVGRLDLGRVLDDKRHRTATQRTANRI